jgi:hypothetical protein
MKLILLLLLIPSMMNAQNKYQENRASIGLKGDVKQVVQYAYNEYGNTKDIYEFNFDGNVTRHKIYDKNNKLFSDFLNEYESGNLRLKQTDLNVMHTWTYEYDSFRHLIKNTKRDSSNRITNTISLEYENGLLKNETVKNESGTCWKYDYEHDSKNRVIKETEKSCNGRLEGIVEYFYNDDNQVILEKNYDETGEFSYSIESKYNENNDQSFAKTNGDLVSEVHFEYEYDSNKNWIKQFSIMDGQKKLQFERQIIYY